MQGEIHDYPTRILVHSEEEGDKAAYLVDLCAFDVNKDRLHAPIYNGACQCKDFIYRWRPKLKDPVNSGKIYRCKHIRWARENCLDFILPKMAEMDPNLPEDHQI